MNFSIEDINWDRFSDLAAKIIKYRTETSRVCINADLWEEVIYEVLDYMGFIVDWDQGSHRKGVDLVLRRNLAGSEICISAKGGKINLNDNTISMSSYRLTRYTNINEMLDFLKENSEEIDIYLLNTRYEDREYLIYYIFKIESHLLVPESVLKADNWAEEDQAWVFRQDIVNGLDLRIVKKMSFQLWYKISMKYKPLVLLKIIKIKKDTVASKLTNILKDLDH